MPQPVFSFLLWCPHQQLPRVLTASFSLFLRTDGYTVEEIPTHTPMTVLSWFPKYLIPKGKILIKILRAWDLDLWMDHRIACYWEVHVRVIPFKTFVIRPFSPNLTVLKLTRVRITWGPGHLVHLILFYHKRVSVLEIFSFTVTLLQYVSRMTLASTLWQQEESFMWNEWFTKHFTSSILFHLHHSMKHQGWESLIPF